MAKEELAKEIVMRATCLAVISMCLAGCAEIGHEPWLEDETALAATDAPPLNCQPDEIFLESQDWWGKQTPTGEIDRGHVHTGLCWKHKATLSGTVTLRVRTVLHDNPGTFEEISIQIWQDGASNNPNIRRMLDPVRTIANCADTGGTLKDNGATCIWVDDIQVDTNLAPYDGKAQFRVRSILEEPDGEEMFTSTGLHATLANGGKPLWNGAYPNMNDMEARGWYTGAGYTTAFIYNPPAGPVSGIWSPVVAFKTGAGEPPNEHGDPVTGHLAALDTDFHNATMGWFS